MCCQNYFVNVQLVYGSHKVVRVIYFDAVNGFSNFCLIIVQISYNNPIGGQVMIECTLHSYSQFAGTVHQNVLFRLFDGSAVLEKHLDRGAIGDER